MVMTRSNYGSANSRMLETSAPCVSLKKAPRQSSVTGDISSAWMASRARLAWWVNTDSEGYRSIILVFTTIPPLSIIALLDSVALVFRQTLPAVPFIAQMLFILWRQPLPTLIVFLDFVFFRRRKVAPIVVGGHDSRRAREQKQNKHQCYGSSRFHLPIGLTEHPRLGDGMLQPHSTRLGIRRIRVLVILLLKSAQRFE